MDLNQLKGGGTSGMNVSGFRNGGSDGMVFLATLSKQREMVKGVRRWSPWQSKEAEENWPLVFDTDNPKGWTL